MRSAASERRCQRTYDLSSQGLPLFLPCDEAHCISEWGHDFRPSYRNLHAIRETLPTIPLMTLTATASTRVQRDILQQLQLRDPLASHSSSYRPNLHLRCTRKTSKAADLLRIANDIEAHRGSTIVLPGSRKGRIRPTCPYALGACLHGEIPNSCGFSALSCVPEAVIQ